MGNTTINSNHFITKDIDIDANSWLKLVIFTIGKLTLGLPIKQVQKVVKYNRVHGSGLSHVNLTHLEEQEVAVIDLHQKLFKVSLREQSRTNGYFIITKPVIGESLGIMVTEIPILLDVPLSQIRTLPESYRHADTLAIASHVGIIPQSDQTTITVFILDLEKVI